jgi:lipopolysaccharide export system protein LptA
MIAGLALLLLAAAYAQHVRQGSVATITSDELEIDYGTGVTEMTGNVSMTIRGDYTATMAASRVILKGDVEKSRVLSVEARGPVDFVIDTTDKDGKRTHITASCSREATFTEQTMIVTMVGNAHAEVIGGQALAAQLESAKYDGESMTIDLNNKKISLKKATAEVHLAPQEEKPAAAQGNP